MLNTKVPLPGVHMAGSDAHYNAHLEVGPHGLALFLAPDADFPVLDVNGTSEQLEALVRDLKAALAARQARPAQTHTTVTEPPANPGLPSSLTPVWSTRP